MIDVYLGYAITKKYTKYTNNRSTVFLFHRFSMFACWFQPAQISQPTVFFSPKKTAPVQTSEQTHCSRSGGAAHTRHTRARHLSGRARRSQILLGAAARQARPRQVQVCKTASANPSCNYASRAPSSVCAGKIRPSVFETRTRNACCRGS